MDESWYANTAYNYAIGKGLVNTNVGGQGGDDLFGYTLLLGAFYKVFGASLLLSRLFSVLIGFGSLIGMFYILKRLEIRLNIIFIICIMFIFSDVNYVIFRTVRPEAIVLFYLIWSFYFLITGIKENSPTPLLFTGLSISFSFLCHPNGALFILLFGLYISIISFRKRNFNLFGAYIIGGVVVLIILLYQVTFVKDQDFFEFISHLLTQERRFNQSFYRNNNFKISFLFFTFNYVKEFIGNYSLGIRRIFIFLFQFVSLIAGIFYYKKNETAFSSAMIGLNYFIISIIVFHPFVLRAFGNVIFFALIILAILLNDLANNPKAKKLNVIYICAFIYLINNIASEAYVIAQDMKNTSYADIERKIAQEIPDNKIVLTLLNFWFPVKNDDVYTEYTRWENKEFKSLDDLLNSGKVDYIIISDYMINIESTTTGRNEKPCVLKKEKIFFDKVSNYAFSKGILIDKCFTNGYGEIKIYKMKIYASNNPVSKNR